MSSRNITIGKRGEQIAKEFLEKRGCKILAQNYRYGNSEIDLIALDNDELAFVEVKTRTSKKFGEPEFAVTRKKFNQMKTAAENFITENENSLEYSSVRFDVIAISFEKGKPQIEHFENVSLGF